MAPKKRAPPSSSSKKTNSIRQQPPASKYGIPHFFERHSQTQTASNSTSPLDLPTPVLNPNPNSAPNSCPNNEPSPSQIKTSSANLLQPPTTANSQEKLAQVSPEFTKKAPLKRFKFSPGLSQDDCGDEITWKISPINERLRTLTAKQLPRMTSILSNPARPLASLIHPCLQKQNPSSTASASLEKWLSSPTAHTTGRSLSSPKMLSVEQDMQFLLHLKALLELLNQVEDVIIDERVPNSRTPPPKSGDHSGQCGKICDLNETKAAFTASQRVDGSLSDEVFLVLEVSEKHITGDSLQAHNPCKILRLLLELTGEERALYLCDEWFYSIIGPGDTVHVVGKFDEDGKCVVSHNENLVVIFPDILVSGTRVASSFNCPRRAVLDERLKASEHSTAALLGTLLHQMFQAGLLKDLPTRHFLEDRAAIILQQNIENLYACDANQTSISAQLLDAIPRILNWIKCFRDMKESETPIVDFGHSEGQKEVSIIEVMDIEEMAWAPKYGLKGIIDASLRIKKVSGIGDSTETIIPLEFKTGKGTTGQSAMEHRAQVILYTLLMSERYLNEDVDSGLLYYLHTDETRAYAGNCENSGLGDLYDKIVGHLTVAHHDFLKHWDHLIDLEAKTRQVACKEIMRARHLPENISNCLSSLILDAENGFSADYSLENGRYIYHFVHQRTSQGNDEMVNIDVKQPSEPQVGNLVCSLKCGDYVVRDQLSISLFLFF
ncbi:hypothetical protein KSP39_PZI022673 [Platanthera zijinensis]|uniref:DNA replication factor Dna2 N-terminal domain-containing protein n=1 Tax=Platanthera zijinensis TaxID=2320716 RepID=A0AAP0AUM5_9ASPA